MFIEMFKEKAEKVIEHLKDELRQIRTGRAQPSLIEGVSVVVEAYGGVRMKLMELAAISAPDATLLTIQPYDQSTTRDIEKAFQVSDLGLNPVVDQGMLRISIPPLTQERRQQLVKVVTVKLEETRVALRSLRSQVKKDIEDQKGDGGISEDDIARELEELQKAVEVVMKHVDQIGIEKEQDLKQL